MTPETLEALNAIAMPAIAVMAGISIAIAILTLITRFVYVSLTNAATDQRKRKERKSKLEYVEYYESVEYDEPEDVTLAAKNDYR